MLPGTLYARLKPCGKPNCRCASGEPEDLHGPYWEWNRREGGRLVHKIVSEEEAKQIEKAIGNRRRVEAELNAYSGHFGHPVRSIRPPRSAATQGNLI